MMKTMAMFFGHFRMLRFATGNYSESRQKGMSYQGAIKPLQSEMAQIVKIKMDLKKGLDDLENGIGIVITNLFQNTVLKINLIYFTYFFDLILLCCNLFFL